MALIIQCELFNYSVQFPIIVFLKYSHDGSDEYCINKLLIWEITNYWNNWWHDFRIEKHFFDALILLVEFFVVFFPYCVFSLFCFIFSISFLCSLLYFVFLIISRDFLSISVAFTCIFSVFLSISFDYSWFLLYSSVFLLIFHYSLTFSVFPLFFLLLQLFFSTISNNSTHCLPESFLHFCMESAMNKKYPMIYFILIFFLPSTVFCIQIGFLFLFEAQTAHNFAVRKKFSFLGTDFIAVNYSFFSFLNFSHSTLSNEFSIGFFWVKNNNNSNRNLWNTKNIPLISTLFRIHRWFFVFHVTADRDKKYLRSPFFLEAL